MLFLQIKQAEVALADGRLDEAYQLIARSEPLRNHRRGQTLVSGLVKKLVERSKTHLTANRMSEALADCEKAQQLGGNAEEVVSLRSQIERIMVDGDRARRHDARTGAVQTAAALVDSAMGRQDLDRAVAELVRAKGNGFTDHRLRELDDNVRSDLESQIESSLNEGRLDQIDLLMQRLRRLDPEGLTVQTLSRAVEQAHAVWSAIERGSPREAHETLLRLATQLPDAKWIKTALEHLETAEQSLRSVRTGPLGLLATHAIQMPVPQPRVASVQPVMFNPTHGLKARVTDEQLPMKFLVQIDGAGSYLVARQPRVTIGPISSVPVPDIGLIAEPTTLPVTIERIEDDYFLRTAPGTSSGSKLLANGDRIALSPRCRLEFALPNPSSTSAVLELASGRFPRADVRKVILLDRDLIIGAGSTSHIRADQLAEPLVLHVRAGQLWCKGQQIIMDSPITIGGVSMVVTMG